MSMEHPNPLASSEVERPLSTNKVSRLRSTQAVGVLIVMAFALASCGLQPLYSGGSTSAVASTLQSVSVEPIAGKSGWLVRNAISDRLSASGKGDTRYRLVVALDDQIEGFGVRADDTVTRERRTLRARYQLIDNSSGQTLLDATAGSDAGIDVVSSEYATIAAENTALENLAQKVADQIVTRLSIYAREGK